jgi:hypothetical protein
MAGILVTYGLKSIPAAVVETRLLNGTQEQPEARVNGRQTPVAVVPTGVEPVVD